MTSGEWQERAFQDVIDFREGPGILARDFREHGVPLVRLAGLNRGVSVLEGCDYLDPEAVSARWSHFQLELGDILLSTSASLGRIAVVGQEGVGAVPYTGIIRMRPMGNTLYAPFIKYLLEGPDFQQQAEMVGVGSVIRHFGPMHLRQMTVRFPSLPEQRAIAHVLGTLDDKIELNRRMNETLEAMARALFKSWFVDFEPVRAKMDGRWRHGESLPGLPAEHYDLFPDRLVDSELGETPEGWETKALGDLFVAANVRLGSVDVPEYSCTNEGLIPRSDRFKKKLSMSNSKNKVISKGDFVFGLSRRVLNFGLMRDDIGCVSPAYRTYSTNQDLVIPDLLERMMRLHSEYFYLAVSASSREGQSISQDALYGLKVSLPTIALQHHLNHLLKRISLRSAHGLKENDRLGILRDTLLPKLVSGEVEG